MTPITAAFYDIETLTNFFGITFLDINTPQNLVDAYIKADINKDEVARIEALSHINYRTFSISPFNNDLTELLEFLNGITLLIGYNNIHFDDLLIDWLVLLVEAAKGIKFGIPSESVYSYMYNQSQRIIQDGINYRYIDESLRNFKPKYISIDLLATIFESVERKSLKQVSVNLKWYRVEDMPIHHSTAITESQSSRIFYYNFNDVLITRALFIKKRDIITSRYEMSKRFDLDLMNCNKSKIADKILVKYYSEYTGQKYWQFKDKRTIRQVIKFRDIINEKIHFNTPELKKMHEEFLDTKFTIGNKFKKLVLFHNKGYTVALGGLHSVDNPKEYIVDGIERFMRDADVESYYPNGVINEDVCPAHLAPVAFKAVAQMITITRIKSKHLAKSLKATDPILAKDHQITADTMKITANSGLFGKFGFAEGWLFDMKALFQVTINLQLYLFMLIEPLEEAGMEVISANTDGITTIFRKDQEDQYNKICRDWMRFTNFNLEFNDYLKYWRTSVNDYLALYKDPYKLNEPKVKGEFLLEPELHKGWFAPVISKAVNAYLRYGTPLNDVILAHRDIYDFCISVKTGDAYDKELHTITEGKFEITDLSKTLRYYVSNRGGALLKRHSDNDSTYNMLKGKLITPFNTFFNVDDFSQYDINYNFYYQKAHETILKIKGQYDKPRSSRKITGRGGKGVKQIGTMFD